jgi:outer membrane protein assembly factor BamB
VPGSDWPTFGYDASRSGAGPADTGITAADVHALRRITVSLDGTVDAAPIELHAVRVAGSVRDVIVLSTTYGRTEALDAASGRRLWEFAPASVRALQGAGQVDTATPVADPDRAYVYTTSPDGYVRKLRLDDGRQVWATQVTHDPTREKMDGALNFGDGSVIAVTGGYFGDAPVYQGHVATLDPATGRITHVFNALCSQVRTVLDPPSRCAPSGAAIWGRSGSVLEPNGDLLVATGNGPFNGRTDWGDSVLELSPSLQLLHNWTPRNQAQLNSGDVDLGSTEPALLPARGNVRRAVQGGKDGLLRLLDLGALDGTRGPAGPRTGGELERVDAPGPTEVFSQPAVWHSFVFVTDGAGTSAYRYGADDRLRLVWSKGTPGTSPVVAGGLLYVFDENDGVLDVRDPASGRLLDALPAASGHWNSPIVAGGRIILPVGSYQDHATSGRLYIYKLPGH